MAFVNEYVSEEDVERYHLFEIWLKHNVLYKKEDKISPFEWIIDRERDIYLMQVRGPGYDRFYTEWVLYWRQEPVTVHLSMPADGGSNSFEEQPYRVVWALDRIYYQFIGGEERQEFLTILKEALRVYGYAGAFKQAPGVTEVSFLF